jgi:hypothetical protein
VNDNDFFFASDNSALMTVMTEDAVDSSLQTKENGSEGLTGIIYPPPEIRTIVDKTAAFVARSGLQLEEKIREKEKANPKFCFLNSNDPYHAYYQSKLRESVDGKGNEAGPFWQMFWKHYAKCSSHCLSSMLSFPLLWLASALFRSNSRTGKSRVEGMYCAYTISGQRFLMSTHQEEAPKAIEAPKKVQPKEPPRFDFIVPLPHISSQDL